MAVEFNFPPFPVGEDRLLSWAMVPPTNITAWTLRLSVRERYETAVLFSLEIGTGITILDATTGTAAVLFSSARTKDLTPGLYVYDLWRTNAGNLDQLTYGVLPLTPRVVEIP